MMLGGPALGTTSLGSALFYPGAGAVPAATDPITLDLNGVLTAYEKNTLQIDDTLGQPMTARFALSGAQAVPVEGDRVRIRYHAQVLFVGTIDRVDRSVIGLTTRRYACACKDLSQILERRRLRRNFTHLPIHSILDSILDNELAGEPLSIGMIDSRASIPLVDSKKATAFDIVRTLATSTGQTCYLDMDGAIQMRSTTVPVAPLILSESAVERDGASVKTDREAYRNHQTVIVTGTAPDRDTDPLTVTIERRSDAQIAARQSVEGGTGRYDSVEEITHPTSNDGVQLALLGIAFANLRLATSGAFRQTVSCLVRGYGFRAGQVATAELPTLGVVGTVVIQRVSIREQFGRELVHQLELVSSSAQLRAYEAWLSIVQGGKVTVQLPSAITNNLATFTAPGAHSFTVPAGVTMLELTAEGGSGGSGMATEIYNGGAGGNSGKAITVVAVEPGMELGVFVGSAGLGNPAYGGPGGGQVAGAGTYSIVTLGGAVVCQGNGGTGGYNASNNMDGGFIGDGPAGIPGAGIGDAVSIGGGRLGAPTTPKGPSGNVGVAGRDGIVEIRW